MRRNPSQLREIWLATPLGRAREELAARAAAAGIVVHRVTMDEIDRLCPGEPHQGATASLREFVYRDLEEVAAPKPDLLVAADGIEDPRNLGALVRGIAAAGAAALVIPRDRAAHVTPTAEKAAAGVTAWFPIVQVTNLARALETLKRDFGFWIAALDQEGAEDLFHCEVPSPTVLVVGGESGLRPLIRQKCDLAVRIPMAADVESLNVSVAAAVGCFELRRRLVDRTGVGW